MAHGRAVHTAAADSHPLPLVDVCRPAAAPPPPPKELVHLCAQIYARIFRLSHSARRVKNIGAYSAPAFAIAPFELKTITMQPCFPSLSTAALSLRAYLARPIDAERERAPLRAFRSTVIVGYRRESIACIKHVDENITPD